MSTTGKGATRFVMSGPLPIDLPLSPGVATHVASVTVSVAGTYLVVGMFTIGQTTASVWLGSVAGADVGVYNKTSSASVAGVAALVKLSENAVVHLNCQATGSGHVVARPDLTNKAASHTSITAALVSP